MRVHHTVGRRQQHGTAKLHRDADCPYLRKGIGMHSEDIPEACVAAGQLCRRCGVFDVGKAQTPPGRFEGGIGDPGNP